MKTYLKKDISEKIGRPSRTVAFWIDNDFIQPDIQDSSGKGRARIFSQRNLIEFGMFDFLSRSLEVPQKHAKQILSHLKGIEDFYTSEKWGISKEMVYSTRIYYEPQHGILQKYSGFFELGEGEALPNIESELGQVLVRQDAFYLGKIRNIAMQQVGITI